MTLDCDDGTRWEDIFSGGTCHTCGGKVVSRGYTEHETRYEFMVSDRYECEGCGAKFRIDSEYHMLSSKIYRGW